MNRKRAKVIWRKSSEGGRIVPPSGPEYSTVARFLEDAASWPEVAWSLVLEWPVEVNNDWTIFADASFLSPDAPEGLLHPGVTFELYEGKQCVAKGEILADSE